MPIPIALGGEPFHEQAETVDAFYERMREGAVATTSQPSPAAFLDAYGRAAERGSRSILSLHLDRRVSGVSASAELAAREASLPVLVVAVPTVSYGVAVCVRAAAKALAGDADSSEAAEVATRAGAALENVFVARSAPSGRVSTLDAWTVLRFADGATAPLSSHATAHDATHAMIPHVVEGGRPRAVAVGYAGQNVEVAADAFAHELLSEKVVGSVERYRVGPSVGAHTGPDSFGAFWWPAA